MTEQGGGGPPRSPDEPVTGGVPGGPGPSPAGAPAGDPAVDRAARPGGAPGEEAAGDPDRMAAIQHERAVEEGEAGDEAARAGAARSPESVAGREADRPSVRRRWRLREVASDFGARDRLARMFDRGRDRGRGGGGGAVEAERPDAGAVGGGLATVEQPGPGGRDLARPNGGRGRRRRGDDGGREQSMVPRAEFRSYYGRPVLKPPVWNDDIAYYFFLGGLSAGSSLLAAGADQKDLPALRRGTRIAALVSLVGGTYYLIRDLGRPERLHHMLRVAKPTSPMSVGTWVLTAYAAPMSAAAVSELMPARLRATSAGRLIRVLARPAGLAAAGLAPAVASYTSVLLSQTAVPAWHESHEELPFIFTSSAAASAGGLGMILAPPEQAAPARRLASYGALVELAASRRLESRLGLVGEVFLTGDARHHLDRASTFTALGTLGSMLLGRRSRLASIASGAALLAGGLHERLGLLHAGIQSTKDPRYVVEPQRRRIEEQGPTRVEDVGPRIPGK